MAHKKNPEPNTLLSRARRAVASPSGSRRPMSRQELADAVNTYLWSTHGIAHYWDETDIGRLERGENRWPGKMRREAFRAVLQVADDSDLGFYIVRRSAATAAPRRRTHRPGTSAPPAARPPSAARPPAPVDAPAARPAPAPRGDVGPGGGGGAGHGARWSGFAAVTDLLAVQRLSVPPAVLLGVVEAHRDSLAALHLTVAGSSDGAVVGAMVGEASVVAACLRGARGDHALALAHCAHARGLAERLGDVRLGALARIFESTLRSGASTVVDAGGDVVAGLRLLDEAEAAGHRLAAPARARIAAEQAQAYAALGLRAETHAALDRAHGHLAGAAPGGATGLFGEWSPARLQVYEGTCHLLLREPAAAVRHLTQARAALAADPTCLQVALAAGVDLAAAHALHGDLDAACSLLGDVYDQVQRTGHRRGAARARLARRRLVRWADDPRVRTLDRRMAVADLTVGAAGPARPAGSPAAPAGASSRPGS